VVSCRNSGCREPELKQGSAFRPLPQIGDLTLLKEHAASIPFPALHLHPWTTLLGQAGGCVCCVPRPLQAPPAVVGLAFLFWLCFYFASLLLPFLKQKQSVPSSQGCALSDQSLTTELFLCHGLCFPLLLVFSRQLLHPTLKLHLITRGSCCQALVHTASSHNKLITSPTHGPHAVGQRPGPFASSSAFTAHCSYTMLVCLRLGSEQAGGKVGLAQWLLSLQQQWFSYWEVQGRKR